MTENPNANTLNTYFQEAMARRPSERVNDDWPKHFRSISVCSVGLEHLRQRSPEFDDWIRKVDRNNVPDHKKTQTFRPNCRLHRHYLMDLLPRVFPVLRGFTRTYFIDCRNLQEPPRDEYHRDPPGISKKHTGRSPPMMETSVRTPEWCEIRVRTCDLTMRN